MSLLHSARRLLWPRHYYYFTRTIHPCSLVPSSCHSLCRPPPHSPTVSFHPRLLSVSSSPPQAPQSPPISAATQAPQTLTSLEVLTGDGLKPDEQSLRSPEVLESRRRSLSQDAGFRAINDHAIIGNCRTAALVGLDGCIDWFCHPHFDSASVFAALVDSQRGGHFTIRPLFSGPPYHHQQYERDTNVLFTALTNQERERQKKSTERRYKRRPLNGTQQPQEICIADYLPIADDDNAEGLHWLVREVECKRGPFEGEIECFPCFDYAQARQSMEVTKGGGVKFISERLTMVLTASIPVKWTVSANKRGVFGRFRMKEGQKASLVFRQATEEELKGPAVLPHPASLSSFPTPLLDRTRLYWQQWMQQCSYRGRWNDSVRRSALALKLLFFAPEGSCVAAPTTSLPETLGGVRNWDYRFAWIRDSSFIIAALLRLGFTAESRAFIGWLQRRMAEMEGGVMGHGLQALYGIRGEKKLEERLLPHLRGYLESRPVRIGNAAYEQIQLDIYGEMLETIHLAHTMGAREMDLDLWRSLRPCIDWIVAHRLDKDEGVWEVRGGKQSFTYSRLQIWVAIDRAIKLAEELSRKFGTAGKDSVEDESAVREDLHSRDPSDYAGGHLRSEAVKRANAAREDAPPRSAAAFTALSPTVSSPTLPTSHSLDAKSESFAFLSAVNPDGAANMPSARPTSSVLPDELCEGCSIPAPSPSSPVVTGRSAETFSPFVVSAPPASSTISPVEVFPGLLSSDLEWWRSLRVSLCEHLLHQGYNARRNAFVQHVSTPPHPCTCTVLDAACLAFPLSGFLPPDDPHCINTLRAILSPISEGGLMQNHLIYRYNVSHTKDGFGGDEEGTFALCSNWAIEGLARWGRCGDTAALQQAQIMMEQMVGLSNHVDLYSEELLLHKGKLQPGGPKSREHREKGMIKEDGAKEADKAGGAAVWWGGGDGWDGEDGEVGQYSDWSDDLFEEESDSETRYLQIGNMPQGFSHLAFVNAAIELNAALDERERTKMVEQRPTQEQRAEGIVRQ